MKGILDNFRLYDSQTASKALELNNLLTTINKNDLPDQYQQQFVLLKEKTAILSSNYKSPRNKSLIYCLGICLLIFDNYC